MYVLERFFWICIKVAQTRILKATESAEAFLVYPYDASEKHKKITFNDLFCSYIDAANTRRQFYTFYFHLKAANINLIAG